MRILLIILSLFVFANCSHKEPEQVDSSQNFTSLDEEPFDKWIESFFEKDEYEVVHSSEGGAGDCYGKMKKLKDKSSDKSIILDRFDCGDYGFERNKYLLESDTILGIKTLKSDFVIKLGSYNLTEIYYYFFEDSVLIKTRTDSNRNWRDSIIDDKVTFEEKFLPKDSILEEKISDMESSFVYDSL